METPIFGNAPEFPYNLDQPDRWTQPWFQNMVLAGLLQAGVSDALVGLARTAFSRTPVSSAEMLLEALRNQAGSDDLLLEIDKLGERWSFNKTCYERRDPEKAKVIQWPNNPVTKAADPENYADIFDACLSRRRLPIIDAQTPIGSAGSCFALRIAHQLQAWGYNYVIEEDDLPPDVPLDALPKTAYRMAPARMGTLFNVPSMRQMVERAFGVRAPEKILVHHKGKFIDPFRSISAAYESMEGYLEDYDRHTDALRRALLRCKVFILTLGLTEAWQFSHSGEYTSVAPHRIDPALLNSKELSVEENVIELERLYTVYKANNPDVHLIISVSPVPLNKTFSERDHVVVANSLSKATLRVAAEIFCRNHPEDTSYFPSFEAVIYGSRNPWESDMRHVSSEAVGRVMTLFQQTYFIGGSELLPLQYAEAEPRIPRFSKLRRLLRPVKRLLIDPR